MTDDPITGGWTGYAITTPVLPDYPKFGIWSDGYYMTTNENLFDGSAIYAFDRAAIEAGLPLVGQRAIPAPPPLAGFGFQAFTPADLDGGTPPPAGAPDPSPRRQLGDPLTTRYRPAAGTNRASPLSIGDTFRNGEKS